tara:strand:- start:442 stop:903 length:462 start_codon:yes stop_codon:yes gene_type:complete
MTNSPTCETKRILIIDDDADFAESLAVTISRSRPFEIEVENHSQLARTTALRFRPDLMILDVMMDRLSGPDLYFLFQRDENLKRIPIVIISGIINQDGEDTSAVGLGFVKRVPRLSKPFALNHLLEAMDAQLEKASRKRAPRRRKKQPFPAIA